MEKKYDEPCIKVTMTLEEYIKWKKSREDTV